MAERDCAEAGRDANHGSRLARLLVLVVLVVGGPVLAACQPVYPTECNATWVGPAGGSFAAAENWSTGRVPGSGTWVCADPGSSIVVTGTRSIYRLDSGGDVEVVGSASLAVKDSSSVGALTLAGTVGGSGSLAVDELTLDGGRLIGSGTVAVASGGTATLSGGAVKGTRRLELTGTTDWPTGTIVLCDSGTVAIEGSLTTAGATVDHSGCSSVGATGVELGDDASWHIEGSTMIAAPVHSAADIDIAAGASLDTATGLTQTGGTLELDTDATLSSATTIDLDTTVVRGSGTIDASVTGTPTIEPGGPTAAGTLAIDGDLDLHDGATLRIDVGGPTPGTDTDLIAVTGAADLTGAALEVAAIGGYTPAAGDLLSVITAATVTGPVASFAEPGGTGHLIPTYPPSALALRATVDCDPATFHPGANLSGLVLHNLDLRWCDLTDTLITSTDLYGSDLSGSNLQGAMITMVDLSEVDLIGADLTGSVMWWIDDNAGTDFTGATCTDGTPKPAAEDCDIASALLVTSTADLPDATTGDGVCQTINPGECTLRAAVMEANATVAGDAIGCHQTISCQTAGADVDDDDPATGDLDVTGTTYFGFDEISTSPGSAFIDARGTSPIGLSGTTIHTGAGSAPLIRTNGPGFVTAWTEIDGDGTAFELHGHAAINGISVAQTGGTVLTHDGGTLTTAAGYDGYADGGLLVEGADVVLGGEALLRDFELGGGTLATLPGADVTVENGTLTGGNVGIANAGAIDLVDSEVRDAGVGVVNLGQATLNRSVVHGSTAGASDPAPSVSFGGITFSGHGGLVTAGSGATTMLDTSTVSSNRGGGVHADAGTTTLAHATVTRNEDGGVHTSGGTLSASSSIIGDQASGPDCSSGIDSSGWNLTSDASCGLTGTDDLEDVDPMLGPFAADYDYHQWSDHFAITRPAHRPLHGSPAIDSAEPGCTGTDPWDVARPIDEDSDGAAVCDRGAMEALTWQPQTFTVNTGVDADDAVWTDGICATAAGTCSFRAAIIESNSRFGTDTITIAPGVALTNSFSSVIEVSSDIVIHGNGTGHAPGLAVRGGRAAAFDSFRFRGLTAGPQSVVSLIDSTSTSLMDSDGSLGIVSSSATDVRATGSTTIHDSSISQAVTSDGDLELTGSTSPMVFSNGTARIEDSALTGSSSAAALTNTGSATVTRSIITGASSKPAMRNTGTTTIDHSRLSAPNSAALQSEAGAEAVVMTSSLEGVVALDAQGVVQVTDSSLHGTTGAAVSGGGDIDVTNTVLTTDSGLSTCSSPITSSNWNAAPDMSCGLTGPNDLEGTPLGLTRSIEFVPGLPMRQPIAGSPLIDSGAPTCGSTDLVGRSRPIDGDGDGTASCDRGAVESLPSQDLSFIVDVLTDGVDANPGDAVCAIAAGGCTLRAAVMEANTVPGSHTIMLPAGATVTASTIPGYPDPGPSVGDLDVVADITIVGSGSTASAAFDFYATADITSANLGSISAHGASTTVTDGGVGSITNGSGTLELTDVTVTSVSSTGPVQLTNVVSSGSITASGGGSASDVRATSITSGGSMSVDGAVAAGVTNNGSLTLTSSTITGGTTAVKASASATSTSIDTATLQATGPAVEILGGNAQLDSVTVTGAGKGVVAAAGAVELTNTVIERTSTGPACSNAVTSTGWNLMWDSSCGATQPSDLQGVDPGIAPLSAYGPVPAALPRVSSPAVDSGPPSCPGTDVLGTTRPQDGNGDATSACDRGAVEVLPPTPLTLTVTTTADGVDAAPGDGVCQTATPGECTLRAAVMESNARNGVDVIKQKSFSTSVGTAGEDTGLDDATTGDLDIHGPVTLQGRYGSAQSTLDIASGAVVAMDNLAMPGGLTNAGTTSLSAVSFGTSNYGGSSTATVSNSGTLTVETAKISWTRFDNTGNLTLRNVSTPRFNGDPQIAGTGAVTVERSFLGADMPLSGSQVTITGSTLLRGLALGSTPATITDSTLLGPLSSTGAATVTNSILASCSGTVISGGYNLSASTGCGLTQPTDLTGADLRLGKTNNNGGGNGMLSTLPLADSPALDTGRPGCTGTDQRGKPRVVDGDADGTATCDRGAVELGPVTPKSFTVTSTADRVDNNPGDGICQTWVSGECTLRAAVMESNTTNGPDTITLPTATYELTATWTNPWAAWDGASSMDGLWVESELVLPGNGSTIVGSSGNYSFSVLGALQVSDLDVTGSSAGFDIAGTAIIERTEVLGGWRGIDVEPGGDLQVRASYVGNGIFLLGGTTTIESSTVGPGTITVNGGTLALSHSTVVGSGAVVLKQAFSGSVTVYASILHRSGGAVCSGTITSLGYNIATDATCGLTDPTDLGATDPMLGALAANGGPTRTHLPLGGSPVIDSGPATCPPTDQRGVIRPQGAACDRGAVEQ